MSGSRTPPRSYIPSFLQRRLKKTRRSPLGRTTELKQKSDSVSKSVDSLLAVHVSSSGIMPPNSELRPLPGSEHLGGQSTGPASVNGHVRRHSFDVHNGDEGQFFDCWDGVSEGEMTSSSLESSPVRRPAYNKGRRSVDKLPNSDYDSPESPKLFSKSPVDRQLTSWSLGTGGSASSERDFVDSEGDDVFHSGGVAVGGVGEGGDDGASQLDMEGRIDVISDDSGSMFFPSHSTHVTAQEQTSSLLHSRISGNTFFMLNIHLKEGRDLVIRDSCGTSDPYVKFKYGGKQIYKSRTILKNLNPRWDEQFSIPFDDISKPLNVKVFDYDRAWNDDPMGGGDIDLSTLEPDKETELKLNLSERGKSDYMGYLLLTCCLVVKSEDDKEQFFNRRSHRPVDAGKKMKMQLWSGIVTIVLVEGSNLMPMDDNGLSDPYVKFRLGTEKHRSKFKLKTLNPKWLEQFDLRLYDEQLSQLEVTVYDHDSRGKDDFMGRGVIDISPLEREKTHVIEQKLEDGAGVIKLLLTITGTCGSETTDLSCYTPNAKDKDTLFKKYSMMNSLSDLGDVGHLEVKVFRAHGLQAADFGGFSDPFCVLELVNDRVQTQTEYKTLNPEWAKVFTFQVKDIHSILEMTVYDEDRNKKVEFLGKIAVPLIRIRNGERRWYALKDRKLMHKTKGAILLEMDFVFNQIKAAIRTVNPREEKFMMPDQKFKISVMKQNVNRISQLIGVFMETGRFVQSCFDWQSPPRTITAFIVYLVIVWNFEIYMLPISLLLIFLKNLLVAQIVGGFRREPVEDEYHEEEDDDDDEDKDKTEEKKSMIERYHTIQEVCLQVQQGLDTVACLGERVKNTFNWSVPWLSTLAVIALTGAMIVLFYIPLRYLLLAWGINKFTKKLRKPNAISNNELLDFLSCMPSDNELLQYRELRPDIPANTSSNRKKRS